MARLCQYDRCYPYRSRFDLDCAFEGRFDLLHASDDFISPNVELQRSFIECCRCCGCKNFHYDHLRYQALQASDSDSPSTRSLISAGVTALVHNTFDDFTWRPEYDQRPAQRCGGRGQVLVAKLVWGVFRLDQTTPRSR